MAYENKAQQFEPADQSIQDDIAQAIHDDENLSAVADDIRVLLQNGEIILEGEVLTPEQSDLAVNTATAFIIPEHVVNRLEVKPF